MKTFTNWENWDVLVYCFAVILVVVLLLAITAVPRNPAELFPNPSARELVQGVRCERRAAIGEPDRLVAELREHFGRNRHERLFVVYHEHTLVPVETIY